MNTEGMTFGLWYVMEELGGGKIRCRCECGTIKICNKYQVTKGLTKSCGCMASKHKSGYFLENLEGQKINEWEVLKELGHGKVLCRCSCGVEKELSKATLKNGTSKSCGHNTNKFVNRTDEKFGAWTIKEELGHGFVVCECKCGSIHTIKKATLLSGASKSCGCLKAELGKETLLTEYGETTSNRVANPRERWQIDAIANRDNMLKYLKAFVDKKPTIKELTKLLNISEAYVGKKLTEYKLTEYVDFMPKHSEYEQKVVNFIQSICDYQIITNTRKVIDPLELDIFIPEIKLAIEINGVYWHSEFMVDKHYHINKTEACNKLGIRLIHLYEYEFKDMNKIERYIKNVILSGKAERVYARDTTVKVIDNVDSKEFLNNYHIQGYTPASVSLGIFTAKDELLGVMTFGTPRFDRDADWELLRLCYKDNTRVIGGSAKLLKYFISEYKVNNVVSYCNIDKFTGAVYEQLGFKLSYTSEPNYVWYNPNTRTVASRYKTQKQRLISLGLGTEDETESQILHRHGAWRIYDCGNAKYVYENK